MAHRTSAVLKIINGSAEHDSARRRDERKVTPKEPPSLPPWIEQSPAVKVAYDWLCSQFAIAGIHGSPDGALMHNLAETLILRNEAVKKLQQFGPVMKDPQGKPTLQPYFRAVSNYNEQIIRMMKELGFTPVSRLKLAPPTGEAHGLPATWDEID